MSKFSLGQDTAAKDLSCSAGGHLCIMIQRSSSVGVLVPVLVVGMIPSPMWYSNNSLNSSQFIGNANVTYWSVFVNSFTVKSLVIIGIG